MGEPILYSDFCCFHACFASLLKFHGCQEPALVLGNIAKSNARLTGDGIRFGDNFEPMSRTCERRGYSCEHRPGFGPSPWEETRARLEAGQPVIMLVDAYYLPHYWIGYQRMHTLHAVVLWSLLDQGRRIRFSDPYELLYHDGVLPVETAAQAWESRDIGQAAIDILPTDGIGSPSPERLFRELRQNLLDLLIGDEQLACLDLAQTIRNHLAAYLSLTERVSEPNARLGRDDRRRACSHFLRGILNLHHTLRWFAVYCEMACRQLFGDADRHWIRELNEIAQTWLVLRNIFLKFGLATGPRRKALADNCDERLARLIDQLEQLAPRIRRIDDPLAISRWP